MPEDDGEPCDECELAALGGMTLNVCKTYKAKDEKGNEMDCKTLFNKFVEGEMTLGELVETVEKGTKDPQALEELDEIKKLAQG